MLASVGYLKPLPSLNGSGEGSGLEGKNQKSLNLRSDPPLAHFPAQQFSELQACKPALTVDCSRGTRPDMKVLWSGNTWIVYRETTSFYHTNKARYAYLNIST